MKYRKKPVVVEATRWFQNGDHPGDRIGEHLRGFGDETFPRLEGAVVRFYRDPDVPGGAAHSDLPETARPGCHFKMDDHGWIDTMEGGHTVCPGDMIITGVQGELYPCETSIFRQTYEAAPDA